jgi:F420-0:gamma-glutamyl ligase-like protein
MINSSETTRYAIIIPASSTRYAQRVPAAVRRLLGIDIYEVTDDDAVRQLGE